MRQTHNHPAPLRLTLPAPAKLNLFLHIIGRRPDGYHLLQTVFQLLDYGDTLTLEHSPEPEIALGSMAGDIPLEENLIFRAARALQLATGCTQGARIQCHKRLPMGGGLGGGSSNAATALLGLNHLWNTGLNIGELARIGLSLGADVPVFVRGKSAWAEGVGECLSPIVLPQRYYLVVAPPCSVDTGRIFADEQLTRNTQPIKLAAFLEQGGRNDCEPVARRLFPAVDEAMNGLSAYGEARLTGTGGCIFLAFDSQVRAGQIAAQLPRGWQFFVARGTNRSILHRALHTDERV